MECSWLPLSGLLSVLSEQYFAVASISKFLLLTVVLFNVVSVDCEHIRPCGEGDDLLSFEAHASPLSL